MPFFIDESVVFRTFFAHTIIGVCNKKVQPLSCPSNILSPNGARNYILMIFQRNPYQ